MDDFDFDFDFDWDMPGDLYDISSLGDIDWGSVLGDIDLSGFDLGTADQIYAGSDFGAGLDAMLGNFVEDVEEQAGGFYGNAPGRAVYDPRTDTTELYDPVTDTLRTITHSDRAESIDLMPDFDESEFTRDIIPEAEQGNIVITGPKTQEDFEDDLSTDYWRNLLGPKSDAGTIEIIGKRPDTLLTDEEHTRVFEPESILTDEEHVRTGGGGGGGGSILTDEEHVRTVGEDTTEEDLKDKFWKNLITKTETKPDTKTIVDKAKELIKTLTGSKDNAALIAALLGGLAGLMGNKPRPVGYQGGIPKYKAVRGTPRSPTEGGRRPGAAGIGSLTGGITYTPVGAAGGGLMGLASGGSARPARYLRGGTDGMADKIQTSIDGKQPARLSHGEFVIPADVVSHLGNGNSDAGADVLYDMMAKVRKARTGTQKQGKQINPRKYTPA